MQFLYPWFLAGLAGTSVPVIIHLVLRLKAKRVLFPSVRFLKQIERRVARRQRLREILLLLLRCLLIALLSLALAGPVYRPAGSLFGDPTVAAVIVLDDTYSMSRKGREGTLFDRARAAAGAVVRTLGPGDSCTVITGRGSGELTRDTGAVLADLERRKASFHADSLQGAVEKGLALLREAGTAQRELYVVSDFQRRAFAFPGVDWGMERLHVFLVPVSGGRTDNVTLESLERVSPFATTAAPFRVRLALVNRDREAANRTVRVTCDGRLVLERSLRLEGNGRKVFAVDLPLEKGGVRRIRAALGGDALPADDSRSLAVEAQARVSVLVCRTEPAGTLSRSHFIERALRPGYDAETGVTVKTCAPEALAQAALSEFAVVFLVEAVPPNRRGADRLREYVAGGGRLVIVAGAEIGQDEFNEAMEGLSPAALDGMMGDETRPATYLSIGAVDAYHPVLRRLQNGERPVDLGAAAFYRAARLRPRAKNGAGVFARFSNGEAAAMENALGAGRVVLLAPALHTDATNFPVKVGFLPFLHSLVAWLVAGGEGSENLRVGDPLRLALSPGADPASAKCAAESGEIRAAVKKARTIFDFGPAVEPGFYRMEWAEAERILTRTVAVNVDPEEADPAVVDPAEALPGAEAHLLKDPETLPADIRRLRAGVDLTVWMWAALLLFLLLEGFLANRFALGKH